MAEGKEDAKTKLKNRALRASWKKPRVTLKDWKVDTDPTGSIYPGDPTHMYRLPLGNTDSVYYPTQHEPWDRRKSDFWTYLVRKEVILLLCLFAALLNCGGAFQAVKNDRPTGCPPLIFFGARHQRSCIVVVCLFVGVGVSPSWLVGWLFGLGCRSKACQSCSGRCGAPRPRDRTSRTRPASSNSRRSSKVTGGRRASEEP